MFKCVLVAEEFYFFLVPFYALHPALFIILYSLQQVLGATLNLIKFVKVTLQALVQLDLVIEKTAITLPRHPSEELGVGRINLVHLFIGRLNRKSEPEIVIEGIIYIIVVVEVRLFVHACAWVVSS